DTDAHGGRSGPLLKNETKDTPRLVRRRKNVFPSSATPAAKQASPRRPPPPYSSAVPRPTRPLRLASCFFLLASGVWADALPPRGRQAFPRLPDLPPSIAPPVIALEAPAGPLPEPTRAWRAEAAALVQVFAITPGDHLRFD